tara:strand:- start:226 stop:669 length:444 start_codon:yes stop_codon:yes gene_type:complete
MRKRRGEIIHSSVWTPKNKTKVNEMFANGSTVVEICKFLGINKSTWYRWLKDPRKGDFQEAVELGIQASESFWIGIARDNLNNKSFNTALFSFMMVNKHGYKSAYSKQEKDITETKTTKVEVKKAVDVEEIMTKLLDVDHERPQVLN